MIGRQVIGKVTWKDERKHKRQLTAIAENVEWELISVRNINVGDFVLCSVLSEDSSEGDDNSCILYLQDKNLPLSNKDEWQKQEDGC